MRSALLVIALGLAACGGNMMVADDVAPPADGHGSGDILAQLQALPGVTVQEMTPEHAPAGYRYFQLEVTQPVDHAAPGGATFQQEVSLIHTDARAPMVLFTTGYDDYNRDFPSEPTELVGGNQISVEYRYFGTSRPDPTDWSKLTIEQMADDEHAIVELLRPIYGGPWISTGGSKGGMTATYHRRFFPDDVAGSVIYVAPLSHAIPDARYGTFLGSDGTEPCADNVRAIAIEMLKNRRAALVSRAMAQATSQGYSYTRIGVAQAVESAILDLEWTFWQYYGVAACGAVPATTASDDALYAFLDNFSDVSADDDAEVAEFDAYFYQAYAQLGSPGTVAIRGDLTDPNLLPFAMYTDADYAGTFPAGVEPPAFDPAPMQDIQTWIESGAAQHFVFEYGQFDPWTGGAYPPAGGSDTATFISPQGTHDDGLVGLSPADRTTAESMIASWVAVPLIGHARAPAPRPPRHHRRPL